MALRCFGTKHQVHPHQFDRSRFDRDAKRYPHLPMHMAQQERSELDRMFAENHRCQSDP